VGVWLLPGKTAAGLHSLGLSFGFEKDWRFLSGRGTLEVTSDEGARRHGATGALPMCGRFTLIDSGQLVLDEFGLPALPPEYRPRYNAAPGQPVLVVREGGNGRTAAMFRWGLVPSWAKDPSIGYKMINARSETLRERPAFRRAFERRRCAVPADGFYEWKRDGRTKTPYRFRLKSGGLFAFAALWEEWRPPGGGESLFTCTIVTTRPNSLVEKVHDRMPVMLRGMDLDRWLDPELPPEAVQPLLIPFPAEEMEAYAVSSLVNSPRVDSAECVEPTGEVLA